MAQEADRPLESIDEKNYFDEQNGETKISKISNGIDETALLIDKLCIKNLINNLQERDKQIILLRYYRCKTQNEVAKMLGISQVQISRIEKKILQEMKQQMIK